MAKMQDRLALHTWTVDTTPLADALRAAREGGFNAVELRRVDFTRCFDQGMTNDDVLGLVKSSGVKVACVGTEYGVIFAKGEERDRLLQVLDQTCRNAVALGCDLVMIAPGQNPPGSLAEGAANYRAAGEVAKKHGVRLALEFNSQHKVINSLKAAREIFALTKHPSCGILLDAYHMQRCGDGGRSFEAMPLAEIYAFQYSDVPAGTPAAASRPTDRLAPGKGVVRWREVLSLLKEKGYPGYLSYEAPNPEHWSRPAVEVAREGAEATRALLAQVE
ncbi:MAG: sugar phosphate isomerase/epimerase [Betaproteobacteria bacterium]|nr:sugar phosphate isomerase/epimerase [Betaproteobacteria bacterium]